MNFLSFDNPPHMSSTRVQLKSVTFSSFYRRKCTNLKINFIGFWQKHTSMWYKPVSKYNSAIIPGNPLIALPVRVCSFSPMAIIILKFFHHKLIIPYLEICTWSNAVHINFCEFFLTTWYVFEIHSFFYVLVICSFLLLNAISWSE